MNSIKLAEENVKAWFLKKLLNLSALNCCKWSLVSQKLFQSLLNRIEQFSKTSNRCSSRRRRVSNIGAMCKFDQNEGTFSVYFDELQHYFIENGQKQHT